MNARKIHITHGDNVVGETTVEQLRASALSRPVVRDLQPDARPRVISCPCGEAVKVPLVGKIPTHCPKHVTRWRCQCCGAGRRT